MYCNNCGNKVLDDANFCSICGAAINKETEVIKTETKNTTSKSVISNPPKINNSRWISVIVLVVFVLFIIVIATIGLNKKDTSNNALAGNMEIRDEDGNVLITIADIDSAKIERVMGEEGNQEYAVVVNFTKEGTSKFADVTEQLFVNGEYLYVFIDDQCVQSAKVNAVITNGRAVIFSRSSNEDAEYILTRLYASEENRVYNTESDFETYAEDDFSSIEDYDIAESFIRDSERMAIDGISYPNKVNGGWVTEQGDWNYYAIWDRPINGEDKNYILKENVVTGEKYKLIESDDHFRNISIMGDWVYFDIYRSGVARIRTDGQYYEMLVLDTQEDIREWFTYNGNFYAIVPEHVSASQVDDYIVKVSWENRAYEKIYNCGNEGAESFLGTENGYAFFIEKNRIEQGYSDVFIEYEFKRVSLDDTTDISIANYTIDLHDPAPDIWSINNGIILGFKGYYGMIAEWTENYFFWAIDLFNYNEVFVREIPELNALRYKTLLSWDLNFYDDAFIMGFDEIIAVGESPSWTWSTITEDNGSSISVANSRIYYTASYDEHHMYCYLDEDGAWHEIKVEEFIPLY